MNSMTAAMCFFLAAVEKGEEFTFPGMRQNKDKGRLIACLQERSCLYEFLFLAASFLRVCGMPIHQEEGVTPRDVKLIEGKTQAVA